MTEGDFCRELGAMAMDVAGDLNGRLVLYAEVEPGVSSAYLMYENSGGKIRYLFASRELQEKIVSFWESTRRAGRAEWRSLTYILDGDNFSLDLIYPDQFNPEEITSDRIPAVIMNCFGSREVDDSDPFELRDT